MNKQNFWCRFLDLHKYEIIEKAAKVDAKDNVIGTVIISRCTNCGKIKAKTIYTEEGYGQ